MVPYQAVPARPHLNPARFAGVRVPRVGERRVAPPRPTPPRPASSPASRTTRGKEHPTARLSEPDPGKAWHRVQERGAERGKDFRAGVRIVTLDPLPGTARTPSPWPAPRTQPASAASVTSSHSPGRPQVRDAAASSKTRPVTAGAQVIPSTTSGFSCAPRVIGSRSVNKNDSVRPSRQMRHTSSVEVAYHCAQHVRDIFHQATPDHSRRPAAHLVERLPTCPIPEITRLGRTLRTWKDAHLPYIDTARASNTPHRSHQRTLSNEADAPPEATPTPPTTNSERSSSQEI